MERKNSFYFTVSKHTDVECVTHIHVQAEIVLVVEGVLHMTISGKEYDIPKGYGVFISSLEPHMFHSNQSNQCQVLIYSDGLVNYFFQYMKTHVVKRHIFPVSNACREILDRALGDSRCITDRVCAEAVLAPLCYEIYCGCEFLVREKSFDTMIYRILEFVNDNFREKITLADVAKGVGLHPVTVSKIFSAQIGDGFSYYLQYIRCVNAAEMIQMGDMTFSEIAYECGFGCIRSFNRSFLTIYKMTPSEYKDRLIKE